MEKRTLGRTGLEVSVLGYGCGAVGGLMVRGAPAEQERAVARALDAGINYFDTAAQYGDGQSETNLGRVLKTLKADPVVGTKVRVPPDAWDNVEAAVISSCEAGLKRLGRERVDLFQLHNPLVMAAADGKLDARAVVERVVPAFEKLHQQGKIGAWGISATGDSTANISAVESSRVATAQIVYNLLNPSAGGGAAYGQQHFASLLDRARRHDVGTLVIRVLAGGALSASMERHATGSPPPAPIGSGADYQADVAAARRFLPLIEEGHVGDLVEASLRFAITHPSVNCVLVGLSTFEQLEHAIASVEKGPLSEETLARILALRAA